MKCHKCENQNDADANYCEHCGNLLLNNSSKSNYKKKKVSNRIVGSDNNKSIMPLLTTILSLKSVWIFTTIFLFALILMGIYSSTNNRLNQDNDRFIDKRSDNPLVEAKVFEIASNFA